MQYVARKKSCLDAAIATPPGYSYKIYTLDGAFISDLREDVYLSSVFTIETSFFNLIKQCLNILWIGLSIFMKAVYIFPGVLVAVAVFVLPFMGIDAIKSLTIGQILATGVLKIMFESTFLLVLIASPMRGVSHLPGYTNYYTLHLKNILSRHAPNIANANGFSIQGIKEINMNTEQQQKKLNDVWDQIKKGEIDPLAQTSPTIIQDDQNAQTMALPLKVPFGEKIMVTRGSDNEDWRLE